jgi:RimJ/RimL family protein N-acetyltransferase
MSLGETPTFSVSTYALRPVGLDDLDDITRLAPHDAELRRWSSIGQITDRASAEAWLRSRLAPGRQEWVVRSPDEDLVGRVSLHDIDLDDRCAEVGYGLFAAHRGRGLARAVVRAVTAYAFADLRLHRITLVHAVANVRSCGVAGACGYLLEGTMRDALDDHSGGLEDAHLHARLSTDPALDDGG